MNCAKSILLGIDIGSTNTKCAAVDVTGHTILISKESSEKIYFEKPGFDRQINAENLWCVVSKVTNKTILALNRMNILYKIEGVGVSSPGCGSILLDSNDCQILIPGKNNKCISIPAFNKQDIFVITGYPYNYINSGVRLASAVKAHPELTGSISCLLSVADYINFKLTGEKKREFSTACSMSMWDIKNREWWRAYFDYTGVDIGVMGKVYESGQLVGKVNSGPAGETGIPEGTSVSLGGHDYLTAAFAAGCTGGSCIMNVLGTYEMIASFHNKPLKQVYSNKYWTFIDHHVYPGKFSYTSEVISAGQVEWLRKNVFSANGQIQEHKWSKMFSALSELEPSFYKAGGREMFIPHIYYGQFPLKFAGNACFLGLAKSTNQSTMLRAAIEGLCFQSKAMFEHHCNMLQDRKPEIIVAGGGGRRKFWLQTKSDILGMNLTVPRIMEASATGAALLAGIGCGIYENHDEASKITSGFQKDYYEPDPERNELFESIYNRVYLPADKFIMEMEREVKTIINI